MRTFTSKRQRLALPQSSLATHSTVVTPMGKTPPEGGVQTQVTFVSESSVALTSKRTTAKFVQVMTVRFVGHWIVGALVSWFTVTVNVQTPRFVQPSVAVQVTSVWPAGKTLPDGGTQTTGGFGS
jgi:hypothetical protein